MYVKVKDGKVEQYPYTLGMLFQENPETSFPENISHELLAGFGVFPVASVPMPEVDYTKNVEQTFPVQEEGSWVQTWKIVAAGEQEIVERTNQQGDLVRSERNAKLSACDWTQLPDAPVNKDAWAEYRQNLRDVTQQAGFPWNVVWPQPPQ
jgi:hypothetical protein